MSPQQAPSTWAWLAPGDGFLLDPIGSLTFVRGATVEHVFAGFGADAADATERTFAEVDPELVELPGDPQDLLRVLDTGAWVVAVEPSGVGASADDVTRRLSVDAAEVVSLTSVAIKGFATFDYYRGGEWITQREVGRWDAAGTDPGRFDAALAQAGLDADSAAELTLGRQSVLVLEVVGRELGFALSGEQFRGPMQTVTTRRHRSSST